MSVENLIKVRRQEGRAIFLWYISLRCLLVPEIGRTHGKKVIGLNLTENKENTIIIVDPTTFLLYIIHNYIYDS